MLEGIVSPFFLLVTIFVVFLTAGALILRRLGAFGKNAPDPPPPVSKNSK